MTQNRDWQPPVPINEQSTAGEYPLDALPTIIRNAVSAYHCYGQQPIPLISSSALANISLACQAHANVAHDHYLVSPVSLYFLTAALSGERKSAADSVFSNANKQWEDRVRKQRAPAVSTEKSLHYAWLMEKEGLLT